MTGYLVGEDAMKPHTNRRTTWLSTRLTTVLCLVGAMIAFTCYGSARAASPPSKAKPLTVKWLDVTTVLLDDGQDAILVDGYFSRYPVEQILEGQIGPDEAQIDAALKRAGITKLDVVLAAHSHLDHALDTPVVAARTGAVVAGSESTANIARGLNFPESRIHVVKDREVLRYGDFKITVIQSPHSPGDLAPGDITAAAQVKATRRVLIFNELGPWSPAVARAKREIFGALQKAPYKIEFYVEYLETSLFPDEASQRKFRDWYFSKYRDRKPDVIIAVGPSPIAFMADSHEIFFPNTPIVFCVSVEALLRNRKLDSDFTGVWIVAQPEKTFVSGESNF